MQKPAAENEQREEHRTGITIAAAATAVPPYAVGREEVKTYLRKVFSIEANRLEAMMAVVDHSQVKQRYCIHPVDTIIQPRPLAQISREYQEHSVQLGRKVAMDCLERAGMTPRDIDMIITVSCTGVMIPSLDAHLINDLGFRWDVRRLPITELGCAAGAAALAKASEFIRAFPGSTVLVIAVEIPSLTFQREDLSQANLISTVLFGDGAAAVVVTGRPANGPRVLGTDSYLFPHSLDAMGFDLKDNGFHIVLSKDVPQLIRDHIKGLLTRFLARHNLTQEQLSVFILHPGGQKLLLYMEEELSLSRCDTQFSWDVLSEYGNLSSASVLFVLQECFKKRKMAGGEYGLMAAFGPGFSSEMLLLKWT
ncbi:MAG: type III polyketide synthase [Acidobacteria bacterium]|nr:type III polyketide synthase [Acidobacteriota bacterium]